jgi:hypothetical protein
MSNPYQTPQTTLPPAASLDRYGDREKLRRVAKYQKWVIYALLVSIVMNIIAMSARQAGIAVNLAVLAAALVVAGLSMAAIFLLANELHNAGIGVLCAILMLIPCVSLITLLVINSHATTFLKDGGVQVGLMGANPDLI